MAAFGVRKLFTLFCATPRHPFAYPSSGGVKTITTTIGNEQEVYTVICVSADLLS